MATSVFPCEYSAMDGYLGRKSLSRSDVAWVDAYSHWLITVAGARCKRERMVQSRARELIPLRASERQLVNSDLLVNFLKSLVFGMFHPEVASPSNLPETPFWGASIQRAKPLVFD
jgi:hypothetical protein